MRHGRGCYRTRRPFCVAQFYLISGRSVVITPDKNEAFRIHLELTEWLLSHNRREAPKLDTKLLLQRVDDARALVLLDEETA